MYTGYYSLKKVLELVFNIWKNLPMLAVLWLESLWLIGNSSWVSYGSEVQKANSNNYVDVNECSCDYFRLGHYFFFLLRQWELDKNKKIRREWFPEIYSYFLYGTSRKLTSSFMVSACLLYQ